MKHFTAAGAAMLKRCSLCKTEKDMKVDFYFSKGKIRPECKKCTIQRNMAYQRKVKSWKKRCSDYASNREYMLQYYQDNKDRFAEYRKTFLDRHPDYYRDYADRKRGVKYESGITHSRHEVI